MIKFIINKIIIIKLYVTKELDGQASSIAGDGVNALA